MKRSAAWQTTQHVHFPFGIWACAPHHALLHPLGAHRCPEIHTPSCPRPNWFSCPWWTWQTCKFPSRCNSRTTIWNRHSRPFCARTHLIRSSQLHLPTLHFSYRSLMWQQHEPQEPLHMLNHKSRRLSQVRRILTCHMYPLKLPSNGCRQVVIQISTLSLSCRTAFQHCYTTLFKPQIETEKEGEVLKKKEETKKKKEEAEPKKTEQGSKELGIHWRHFYLRSRATGAVWLLLTAP